MHDIQHRKKEKNQLPQLLELWLEAKEADGCKVGDIAEDTMIIRGKGGKHRYVFLSPEVRLSLRRYIRACPCNLGPEDPLWVRHQAQYTPDWTRLMAGSTIALVPALVVFVCAQRYFVEGIQLGAVRG